MKPSNMTSDWEREREQRRKEIEREERAAVDAKCIELKNKGISLEDGLTHQEYRLATGQNLTEVKYGQYRAQLRANSDRAQKEYLECSLAFSFSDDGWRGEQRRELRELNKKLGCHDAYSSPNSLRSKEENKIAAGFITAGIIAFALFILTFGAVG